MVQWESPVLTGGTGVSITRYTVTVDGQMFQTVSHDGREIFTTNITELDYNTRYNVAVTTTNSCGFSSSPTNTSVFIEARGKCSMFIAITQCFCFAVPPQPTILSIIMYCDVALRDSRPVIINWKVNYNAVALYQTIIILALLCWDFMSIIHSNSLSMCSLLQNLTVQMYEAKRHQNSTIVK